MKWFVYSGMDYYPSARVIEADTAELALKAVGDFGEPYLVFPWDSVALKVGWNDAHENRSDADLLALRRDG